jgi:hypothetical protein
MKWQYDTGGFNPKTLLRKRRGRQAFGRMPIHKQVTDDWDTNSMSISDEDGSKKGV